MDAYLYKVGLMLGNEDICALGGVHSFIIKNTSAASLHIISFL